MSDINYILKKGTVSPVENILKKGTLSPVEKLAEPGETNFLERLKLSFGGPEAQAKKKKIEEQAGLRGKFDIGDIADIVGGTLPIVGSILGGTATAVSTLGTGTLGGIALGAGAGEATKEAVGRMLGVRSDVSVTSEIAQPIMSGILTYAGGKVLQKVGGYVAGRFPKAASVITGEQDPIIRSALANPKAADIGIAQGDDALRSIVKKGAEGSLKLKNDFIKTHIAGMQKLFKGNTAKIANRSELLSAFQKSLNEAESTITKTGKLILDKEFKAAYPQRAFQIKQAFNLIKSQKKFTFESLYKLKQAVGQNAKFPKVPGVASKNPVLGSFYHYLNEFIKAKVPKNVATKYNNLNEIFTDHIRIYDQLVEAFNKGDPFKKVASVFAENNDTIRRLMQFYEEATGEKIMGAVAGRAIASEKQASFFLNPRAIIDLIISPKAQAKGVTISGRIGQRVSKYGGSILGGASSQQAQDLQDFLHLYGRQ